MQEMIKIKLGQEKPSESGDVHMVDDNIEKDVGACLANLKKIKIDIISDMVSILKVKHSNFRTF